MKNQDVSSVLSFQTGTVSPELNEPFKKPLVSTVLLCLTEPQKAVLAFHGNVGMSANLCIMPCAKSHTLQPGDYINRQLILRTSLTQVARLDVVSDNEVDGISDYRNSLRMGCGEKKVERNRARPAG